MADTTPIPTKESIMAELEQHLDEEPSFRQHALRLFSKWLDRGDGVAIYENRAFDSSNFGHKQFVSYGSSQAQIEAVKPPQRMPDIGAINWAYQLVAQYRFPNNNDLVS